MDAIVESINSVESRYWQVPEGWEWALLSSLGKWTGGGTPSKANSGFWTNGTVPWVSPKDMKIAVIGETADKITQAAVEASAAKYVEPGSVLMVMRSGILRHSFPVAVTDRVVTLNQDLRALTPCAEIDPRFLAHFLTRFERKVLCECSKDGTTVNSIEVGRLERIRVPIPSLAEQRRIVARIDALFAEIAEGEAALARVRQGLDTFRRALLKSAVTGELTKDWRETHAPGEARNDLFQRIRKSSASKQGATSKSLHAVESATRHDNAKIPESWVWTDLKELASSIRNGTSAVPRSEPNSNEILRISAVRPLLIDENQVRYLSDEQATVVSDVTVELGDLLFTRYNGSADLVGVSAVYKGRRRFYPDKIIRVRLHKELAAYAGFVELAVNSWVGRAHITSNIKTTAGQHGIAGEAIKSTPIPVCPADEATEILHRVNAALAAQEETLKLLEAEAADAQRLRQAILKAAFEGRLVPQDPTDEPASALVARLAVQQRTAPNVRGRRRRTA